MWFSYSDDTLYVTDQFVVQLRLFDTIPDHVHIDLSKYNIM